MHITNSLSALTKRIIIPTYILFVFSTGMFTACKKVDPQPEPPGPEQPGLFFITEIIDTASYVGLVINDPIDHKQYAAFGPKNAAGKMDTIVHVMERYPDKDAWVSHELDENFDLKQTTTSTGHTVEYRNVNKETKTGSITVKETSSGTVVWKGDNIPWSDNYFDLRDEAVNNIKSGNSRKRNKKAEMTYLVGNMAGCAMGIASLGAGGPLALAWGAYNTYQSCKSVADGLNNVSKGQPAYGCVSGQDHANAFSGIGEAVHFNTNIAAIGKAGLPTLVGYMGQLAGQEGCGSEGDDPLQPPPLPELPPRDIGSMWGDPHIGTLDGFFYDFHGFGEFIAAKSITDNFEVQVRLGNPYSNNPQTTYNTAVAVQTGNDAVAFLTGPWRLYINNTAQPLNFSSLPLKDGASITRQETGNNKQELTIKHKNGDLVKIRLHAINYLDYSIQLTESRKGKMEGLLGNYDGDALNDLRLKNGNKIEKKFTDLYPKYADSWRIDQANSLFYYGTGENTETFTRKDLPKSPVIITPNQYAAAELVCRAAGVRNEPYISGCIVDVATSGDANVALSSYQQQELNDAPRFPPLDITNVKFNGDAQFTDSSIRLTRNVSYIAGQAFNTQALSGDFETSFVFRFGPSINGGADGIAFVIAKEIPESISNPHPGNVGKLGYTGISNSLAVEFDTSIDGPESANHVALHTNGSGPNSAHNDFRIVYNNNIPPMEDGMYHHVKIRYQQQRLLVWIDGMLALDKLMDIKQTLGLNNSFFIGITASTSSSTQAHFIHSWETKDL